MENPNRKFVGKRAALYFKHLTDQDIQDLIIACQQELELRSQESIVISDKGKSR